MNGNRATQRPDLEQVKMIHCLFALFATYGQLCARVFNTLLLSFQTLPWWLLIRLANRLFLFLHFELWGRAPNEDQQLILLTLVEIKVLTGLPDQINSLPTSNFIHMVWALAYWSLLISNTDSACLPPQCIWLKGEIELGVISILMTPHSINLQLNVWTDSTKTLYTKRGKMNTMVLISGKMAHSDLQIATWCCTYQVIIMHVWVSQSAKQTCVACNKLAHRHLKIKNKKHPIILYLAAKLMG